MFGRKKNMLLEEAASLYLLQHQANGSSKRTVENYRWRFRPLLKRHGQHHLSSLDKFDLLKLVAEIRATSRKQTTANCYIQAFKALFNWLHDEGFMDKRLSEHIHKKRARDIGNKAMSLKDFEKMRNACRYYRNYALLTFQADTAARTGEVITLTLDNLRLDELEATVIGKMGERIVHYTPPTVDVMKEYLTNHRPDADHNFVFTNLRAPYNPLNDAHSLLQIYKHIAIEAGVEGKWNPHSIRHMVAKHFIREGNMEAARVKLGHDYIATTQAYANTDEGYTAEISQALSILKRFKDLS